MSELDSKTVVEVEESDRINISLIGMLMVIILLSLILVGISYFLYHISPERKFDLARPGDPNKNKVVDVEDTQSDTSTPVSVRDAKKKLDSFNKELKALSGYNNFEPADISDQNIGLQDNDQPSL